MFVKSVVSRGLLACAAITTLISVVVGTATLTLASPFCGGQSHVAPAGGALPPGATIAAFLEDRYVGGELLGHATRTTRLGAYEGTTPPIGKYWATLNGKRVKTTTKDVVVTDGIVRFITIKSHKLGQLQLWTKSPYDQSVEAVATYDVVAAQAPKAALESIALPRVSVGPGQDLRMSVYHFVGHFAELTLPDVPAVALRLRWRKAASAAWHTLLLPIRSERRDDKPQQVAWLGELVCGMTRNIDAVELQAGIEAEVAAQLVDGSTIKLTQDAPIKIQLTAPVKAID
ncbi:MAG: hypothetical protein KBG15_06185 [Kofleriaceae bacterium]|nr:hypothetical protein [Kofleriaceae bacterium]